MIPCMKYKIWRLWIRLSEASRNPWKKWKQPQLENYCPKR